MKQKFIICQFTPDMGRGYYEQVSDEFVTSQFNATRFDDYGTCEKIIASYVGSENVYAIQKIYVS